ncbi:replication protein A 32 kDa subunit A-like [Lolium rigidum]|uniref:replication protein A 32 kDa subunit A-like n=1 Tax=Lolium rigidum TaxID=89674 RepID=UPI001F5CBD1C|nr:replication protein A 32 kDa subunit A-like [Lolium rigidum]
MVFSSQTGAFSPSQFTPSSTTPLTVKQIAAAQLTGADEEGVPFVVDGVDTSKIRVVGMVSGKAERATDVTFTIDDGTGRIDFIRWVNDAADSAETDAIQNGMYVSVIGTLKGLKDKKRATAFCVRPVTDYNEVPLMTSGTNGSVTDLYTQVLNVFSEPSESDHGVHIDEIAKRLGLPVSKIVDAINFHVDYGHIFSTIDDFHYKSAYID